MDDYLYGLTGRIVIPINSVYDEARQGYNRAIQQYPLIIDYCRDEHDVANAVIWSRKFHVPLRIRNGGHNYEGYSNGNCTLVVDVSEMTRIDLDENENRLTIQSGVTNGQIYEFVSSKGYPFPGGTCPTVGVGGYAMGGGWGLSCRYLGLGCDSLEEIELVNYEGNLIKANRNRNADLFWACRGAGGGNFGVTVSMRFVLPPKAENVTLIEIDYLHVCAEEQRAFLQAWQEWLKGADPRVTLISRIYNSENDGLAMLIRGIFYGRPVEAEQIMKPFLDLAGAEYSIEYMTFLEAVTIIGNSYPPSEKFQSASRFILRDFSEQEISKLVGLIQERPQGSVFAGLSIYALGGKVREVGTNETAFFYRNAHDIIWLETVWEENRFAQGNRRWINRRFPKLASVTAGSYINFPYKNLPDYLEEYYGAHVGRLKTIKKKYDPLNLFTFPQGIGNGGSGHPAPGLGEYPDGASAERLDDTVYRGFRYVKDKAGRKRPSQLLPLDPQVWDFVSSPVLHPMKVSINANKGGTVSGLIFTAPYTLYEAAMIGQTGALIMDQAGNPVWFRPLQSIYLQNADFRVQSYRGRPVLTMWQGTISGTQTSEPNLPAGDPEPGAYYLILNQNYEIIKKLTAQKGYTPDLHEFTITDRNTALFSAVKQVPANLTIYGGPAKGYFDNYSIQEVDIRTGELLFFWSALTHIDPVDSMAPASSAADSHNIWDCFHVNSVEEGPENTLLISMRNMWAVYLIDKKTGKILWQLGGKKSGFTLGPNAGFSWQHDARFRSRNRISLFDDACCDCPAQGPARGLILKLDCENRTADVDRTYYHNPILYVPSQGNVQKLYNGNQFVGWGQEPYLSEFANNGNTQRDLSLNFLYDMQFPNRNLSYRAFKNKWTGLPQYPPAVTVRRSHNKTVVYASWNGSTETAAWQVLAGSNPSRLTAVVESAPRTGFETAIRMNADGPCFQVNALNTRGQIIGTSQIVHARQI